MDVSINPIKEKSQVELKISVTPEELEPYVDQAAKHLSKEHPIKGFRPGKVPIQQAIEHYGKERVLSEALDKGIPRWFVQAIVEHDIDALGRPSTAIDKANVEEGVAFTATVDVLPAVRLGDPSTITIEKRSVAISDSDVEQELKVLAKSRGTYIDVARPAQDGDTVVVDFDVFMNGGPLEGGSSKNHPIHIGEGHFIPDFEQKIRGMQAGDEREITMKFPDDFAQEELRGKEATAKVKAHEVKKRVIPELNDEFAKSLGKFTNLEDLKGQLKANMQTDKDQHEQERLQGELIEKLADISDYDPLPESLIEREIARRIQELIQALSYQQKTLEDYLQQTKKTPQELKQELREPAIRTVKVSLALRQFAQEQGIEVKEEEIEAKSLEYLQHYGDAEKAKQEINEDELKNHIAAQLRNQRALAKLQEIATVKEGEESTEEKQAAPKTK